MFRRVYKPLQYCWCNAHHKAGSHSRVSDSDNVGREGRVAVGKVIKGYKEMKERRSFGSRLSRKDAPSVLYGRNYQDV